MSRIVEMALGHWGLEGAPYSLVAARENAVYEVSGQNGRIALRLHRQGYRSDDELRSELMWMAEVSRGGLSVPAPVPLPDGSFFARIDGVQVDALTWLPGRTMTEVLVDLKGRARQQLFSDLGRDMAQLHRLSDAWQVPPDFQRVHWDQAGLLGDAPLWDRFWENPALTRKDRQLFDRFREAATAALAKKSQSRDYGLIHADLVPANVLVDHVGLKMIDFDDGGYGYRLFDVATALLKHAGADDFPELQQALTDGYLAVRALDLTDLDLFFALRTATYCGWNIKRLDEPGGAERNIRFISTCRSFITRYFEA